MSIPSEVARAELLAGELMSVTAAIRRTVRRQVVRSMGSSLPPAQLDLLIVVEAEPGIGVAGAAQILELAGNSVSTLVNQLVSAGLLRRTTDPSDRRAARLYLTEAASERISRWRSIRNTAVAAALEHSGEDELDAIEQAVPALRKLLDRLRTAGEPR
jgi:DNA-binding MarR family transcriptional regulator